MNNDITTEMINYFKDYVNHHRLGVISTAKKLLDRCYITHIDYNKILEHDKSKFVDPEFTPYVKRKWQEKVNAGTKFGDYHNMDEDVKNAIVHHVTTNDHHPEFWSNDYEGFKSNNPCHINFMPDDCIIEMICDWKSMGDEKGNKVIDWFNKTNGSRWIWTNDVIVDRIKFWINIVDNL